jgi:hypothetical protein
MSDASSAQPSTDTNDWGARAALAFEKAKRLPPGPERIATLKMAKMLRQASEIYRALFASVPPRRKSAEN